MASLRDRVQCPGPRACSTDYGNARRDWRDRRGVAYLGWICRRSGSGSVVVVQQSAETFPSFHFPALTDECWIRADQLVIQALVVAFPVVQLSNTTPILLTSV